MLVNEIKEYTLKLQGREKPLTLRLDFRAIIKMHKIYKNAFLLIYDFVGNNNLENLPKLMSCMAQEEITAEEIENGLRVDFETVSVMAGIVNDLIGNEIVESSEFEVKSESKKAPVKRNPTKK